MMLGGLLAGRKPAEPMRVTILGCGGSGGVPLIGPQWGNCDPANPKNRRRRCSILVQHKGVTLLVDTSPDLREQLIDARISRIDAVLFTHDHADHTHGIDDLRALNWSMRAPIDCFADMETMRTLRSRFGYCFGPPPPDLFFAKPCLVPHLVTGPFKAAGLPVVPFVQDHGYSNSLGFRFGSLAYSTDVVRLDEAAFEALAGVEVWIVDCTRITPPHAVHAHLPVTLSWIARVAPKRAILTHMNHTVDYEALCRLLPPGVEPAYDGLTIELPGS